MSTTALSTTRDGRARDLAWLAAATFGVYAALCWHPLLGSYPRYVLSAREMVEGGDWIVPHLAGVPYFEKPILTYWIAAVCRLVFGASRFAIHLPSGLAAIVSVACTYEFARAIGTRGFALFAALLLLASAQFMVMSTILTTDPLFASWLALAWLAHWKLRSSRASYWVWILWAALGCAWLTKGPLALVFSGLAIGAYAWARGGPRGVIAEFARLKTLRGLALVLAINGPWHWLVWQRDPRFLEMFYVRINYRGLFDPKINHPGPPWYYAPILFGSLAPWTLPAAIALGAALWKHFVLALRASGFGLRSHSGSGPDAEDARLHAACWFVLPLAFLSASSSKLGTYVLPILPPAFVLVADRLWSACESRPRWLRTSTAIQAALLALAGVAAIAVRSKIPDLARVPDDAWPVLVVGSALAVGGWLSAAVLSLRGRELAGLGAAALGSFAALALLLPNADRIAPGQDGSKLAELVAARASRDDAIVVAHECVQDYTIPLALGRNTSVLGKARELGLGFFTEVTPPTEPLPEDPYEIRGETLPAQQRLYSWARLRSEWTGARRIWLFGNIDPDDLTRDTAERLKAGGLTVYEIASSRWIRLLSNRP